jgi:Fic family protein
MSPSNRKLTLLHLLSKEAEPIALPELMEKLGEGFSERTVRRWLAEMTQEGVVEKLGERKGTKYRILLKSERTSSNRMHCFSSLSEKILDQIKQPIYERNPVAYNDSWIESYAPNKTYYIPPTQRKQLYEAGRRSGNEAPAGTYAHQIFNRLLIDLSYNSSRLEGNTYSLLDTKKLLLEGASAEGKLEEEKIMILNHKEAIRYLVEQSPKLLIAFPTILTLHYLLSDGLVEPQYAGKIRNHGVRIGGSTYIPYESSEKLEPALRRILEKGALIEDPYEQSFFLLVHITYLQAFIDVNKRTARMCCNIPLIQHNCVPLSFNDVEKEDYTSSVLAIYELNKVQPLLDLYVFSYMRTCAIYDSTIKAMGFDELRVRYRMQRRSILREVILQKLTGSALKSYIQAQTEKLVKKEDREEFIKDVWEDIREMDSIRIVGLGITPEDLHQWLNVHTNRF